MSNKTLSLVQPNFQQGPVELNAHYLPYSAGVLWSYANQSPLIKENYELRHLIWKREDVEAVATRLRGSSVVGFSTYVWNRNYNYKLASRLKELSPATQIVFGGPEVPITDPNVFKRFPFIDVVVKGEGEISFKNLLVANLENNISTVKGLLINNGGKVLDTGEAGRILDLDAIPSPYTTGVFDKIVEDNPDVEWNSTLETNRGCPYQCTFCDWGSLTYNKVKKFNLSRVFAELEWMAEHKCGHMSICDANFGMFVERDNEIVDKIIALQKSHGYPYTFNASWAKNQRAEVIGIVKKLISSPTFNHGLTLSVQSLDSDVLDAIKRQNLGINQIEEVFRLCEAEGIPVNTEFILGLPSETLQSWKNNFWRLFAAGNHTGIEIFQAQLLENAEMNTGQRLLYGIKSKTVFDYMSGSQNDDDLAEGVDVVIATNSMPTDIMLDAQMFSWFINTFHINGITTYIARFLNKYSEVSYEKFYDELFAFLMTDQWISEEYSSVRRYYAAWMNDGRINHPKVGPVQIHGWNLVHRTIIKMHVEEKYDHIFSLVEKFVDRFSLDQDLRDSLLDVQKNYVIQHRRLSEYPITKKLAFDVIGFLGSTPLKAERTFEFNEMPDISLVRFLELIYYSRRRNFGKAVIK